MKDYENIQLHLIRFFFFRDDPNLWEMIYEIMIFIIGVGADCVFFDWWAYSFCLLLSPVENKGIRTLLVDGRNYVKGGSS